ncbi:MAG: retroviral-like aspartic protease family protein [Prevotellaceae bacterium]|jgi:predicted aspartyl protease|nr:retroviral-like aspartic protease family protein [Prevotellaceae bacterium]
MKKIITFIILWFTVSNVVNSQSIDQKLGILINNQEYFKLKRELQKADSTDVSEFVWNLSNAIVNAYFYNSQESVKNINILLRDYQEYLGVENSLGMTVLLIENYMNLREYKKAAQISQSVITQLKDLEKVGYKNENYVSTLQNSLKMFNAFADIPTQKISNKQAFRIYKDSIGAITVPVSVGNKTHYLIFDTGAGSSIIKESIANDLDIQILADSVIIAGFSDVYCKSGVANNIQIGNINAQNVLFMIIPDSVLLPEEVQDKNIKINGCIGWDFIRDLNKFQIDFETGLLSFDIKENIEIGNLIVSSSCPYVECISEDDTIILNFDTGAMADGLSYNYYKQKSDNLTSIKDTIQRIGGIGGYSIQNISIIKDFPIQIGDKNIVPKMAMSTTEETDTTFPVDGILGMPIISLYDRIIIDFETMSLILKKEK